MSESIPATLVPAREASCTGCHPGLVIGTARPGAARPMSGDASIASANMSIKLSTWFAYGMRSVSSALRTAPRLHTYYCTSSKLEPWGLAILVLAELSTRLSCLTNVQRRTGACNLAPWLCSPASREQDRVEQVWLAALASHSSVPAARKTPSGLARRQTRCRSSRSLCALPSNNYRRNLTSHFCS